MIIEAVLLAEDNDSERDKLLGETIGCAIVDSGCTKTVCGDLWLNVYLESLSREDRKLVRSEKTDFGFRFGVGQVYRSNRLVHIPVHIGKERATLTVCVVSCNVPLLLSRDSLKTAGASLDFSSDNLTIFGQSVPLLVSESGHYCLPLTRPLDEPHSPETQTVMFSHPFDYGDLEECEKKVVKLHKQFAHPSADRLRTLMSQAGVDNKGVLKLVDTVTQNCDVCRRFKKTPSRPVVGMSLASDFNETVAMDLKTFNSGYMLHMIDHATRFSQSCFIRNKRKETIVRAIMMHWLCLFGSPQQFLSDNGGEFVNDEFLELAEKFNITVKTTAAFSPWSNGLVEKHNGILGDMIQKTMFESSCDLEMAIHWCVSAHNSLCNVYGFSPNQLVFGRNPLFPSVHHDRPPAQNEVTASKLISENLKALHAARESFLRQESCERLRRALARQVRPSPYFVNGDLVYFKRNDSSMWHGPAKVLGKDAQNYLLKHGGIYVRVHPCRMQLVQEVDGNPGDLIAPVVDSTSVEPVVESVPPADGSSDESDEDEVPHRGRVPETPPATPATRHVPPNLDASPPMANLDMDLHDSSASHSSQSLSSADDFIPAAVRRLLPHNTSPLRLLPEPSPSGPDSSGSDIEEILFGEGRSRCTDQARFKDAKLEELKRWRDMEVYDEIDDLGQGPRISSRWVCTEKEKGGKLVTKARLVAKGCEEEVDQIKTDSPTCQKDSLRIILCVLASRGWTLKTIDIKCAFLQGFPLERNLYMVPPRDIVKGKVWLLKKCPYGLADAGRKWYLKLQSVLLGLNAKQSCLDQAVFVWYDQEGMCIGLMAVHVDDIIYGGTEVFQQLVITKLRQMLTIGQEETVGMKYIGLMIRQSSHGISVSTDHYSDGLEELPDLGVDKSRELLDTEKTALRHLSGQLNWIATQSRPDLGYDNCVVANSLKCALVKDAVKANKSVRKAKMNTVSLTYPSSLCMDSSSIVGFTDASFGNLPGGGSQGAYVIFLIDQSGRQAVISWQSRRIRRQATSSLAAECIAAVEVAEACIHLRTLLSNLLPIQCGKQESPILILTDNKSLVDNAHSSTPAKNKRLQIEMGVIREMLQRKEISELRWIPDKLNIANPLTKEGASIEYLLHVLSGQLLFDQAAGKFV